ncbi:outer membrane protein assembly factor BamE [Brevundimonas sp. BR2-1]|uniref:outer membrane protein assembly factor BamE domain-containing protein n=1 Tax=Brevundimonas sp. BR2-1 TaxID=3031123 RepID=UPI0030AF6EB1
MVASFLEEHPLKGMTRAEVVELLGPPTPTDNWEGTEMIYVLGPDGGLMAIDHEWLLIELDQQGRVTTFEVVSD